FAATVGHPDWRTLIKTLRYENKGLGEVFVRYLIRQAELRVKPIQAESTIHVHMRKLDGLYRKYKQPKPRKIGLETSCYFSAPLPEYPPTLELEQGLADGEVGRLVRVGCMCRKCLGYTELYNDFLRSSTSWSNSALSSRYQ
ncbi:hypothetical protein B0H67DRAFT_499916, partial [Lasiosphaeris hirsuta]